MEAAWPRDWVVSWASSGQALAGSGNGSTSSVRKDGSLTSGWPKPGIIGLSFGTLWPAIRYRRLTTWTPVHIPTAPVPIRLLVIHRGVHRGWSRCLAPAPTGRPAAGSGLHPWGDQLLAAGSDQEQPLLFAWRSGGLLLGAWPLLSCQGACPGPGASVSRGGCSPELLPSLGMASRDSPKCRVWSWGMGAAHACGT